MMSARFHPLASWGSRLSCQDFASRICITWIKSKLLFLYLAECNTDLGLEHLKISDSRLKASSHSSYESLSHGECKAVEAYPRCARLNNNVCAWCVEDVGDQYLQVDIGSCAVLSGIETQGAEGCTKDYYVRKYKVFYSRDGQTWTFYPVSI